MKIFDTHIGGIVCQCQVTHYHPAVPAKLDGAMEDAVEAMPSEFEFEILDRCGHPAPTLREMATLADVGRLQDEYEAFITAEKHGKDF
jgi:hypothetical protein